MKYQVSSAKPQPAAATKKPFDFVAAQEALSESLDRAQVAYSDLVAAEGRVAEVELVLENCSQALKSINKFGLTEQGMELFNGANHDLDTALGLESLAIESLSTMSAATKDALKAQYVAGLEGTMSDVWKTMVERVKEFFAKLLTWLKEFFTGTAKLMRMVKETSFEGELDGDKKISGLSYDDAQKLLVKDLTGAATTLERIEQNAKEAATTGEITLPEKKEGTLKELGWDAGNAKSLAEVYSRFTAVTRIDGVWKKIQTTAKSLTTSSKGDDPAQTKELQTQLANWKLAGKLTGQVAAGMRLVGFTLLTVSKAVKKAEPAPAK